MRKGRFPTSRRSYFVEIAKGRQNIRREKLNAAIFNIGFKKSKGKNKQVFKYKDQTYTAYSTEEDGYSGARVFRLFKGVINDER